MLVFVFITLRMSSGSSSCLVKTDSCCFCVFYFVIHSMFSSTLLIDKTAVCFKTSMNNTERRSIWTFMVSFYLSAFLKRTCSLKPASLCGGLTIYEAEKYCVIHRKFPRVYSVTFITLPKTFSQESAQIFHPNIATDLEFVDRASHADMLQ